jgi:hypothetical protein
VLSSQGFSGHTSPTPIFLKVNIANSKNLPAVTDISTADSYTIHELFSRSTTACCATINSMKSMHVSKLLIMAGLHFVAMYLLMFAMVNSFDAVFFNLNTFYMAGLMTAPMILLEGFLMGSMYEPKKVLTLVMAASAVLLLAFFLFIRKQTFIGDKEFIRSMIPHHSGAILMCERSSLNNQELKDLCEEIVATQQEEIDQMNAILRRLN